MIVAHHHQHATLRCRPGGVAVFEHVHAAVGARSLAIPQGEHAIDFGVGEQVDLLRPPDRSCGEFLVDARLEVDPVLGQLLLGLPKRLVEITERRPSVSGNEAGGIQPRRRVAHLLQRRQMNQGLDAGHVFQRVGLSSRLGTPGVPRGFIASGVTRVQRSEYRALLLSWHKRFIFQVQMVQLSGIKMARPSQELSRSFPGKVRPLQSSV